MYYTYIKTQSMYVNVLKIFKSLIKFHKSNYVEFSKQSFVMFIFAENKSGTYSKLNCQKKGIFGKEEKYKNNTIIDNL